MTDRLASNQLGLELASHQWQSDHFQAKETYRRQMVTNRTLLSGDQMLDINYGVLTVWVLSRA